MTKCKTCDCNCLIQSAATAASLTTKQPNHRPFGAIRPKHNIMKNKGYTVKGGRMINTAEPLEMGITKMARNRAEMRRIEKVSEIAQAILMTKD